MSAIERAIAKLHEEETISWYELIMVFESIKERLDALEAKAHSHKATSDHETCAHKKDCKIYNTPCDYKPDTVQLASQSPVADLQNTPEGTLSVGDTERSCDNIEVPSASVAGEYWPFLGGEQPRAEQEDVNSAEYWKKCCDVNAEMVNRERKYNDALRARLAEAERIARENGELALERKVEVERLTKEQSDILFLIQTRLQPSGSPCPGGPVMLATWITGEAVKNIERLEKENAELRRKYYDELLFNVCTVFPGESRHKTALRYIREAESRKSDVACVERKLEVK